MAKRDYYEVLGVSRERRCRGNQEVLPQAGREISSGQKSGRQDGRGKIQGTQRGLRSVERPAEARRLRPIRPRRVRPAPARRRGFGGSGGGGFHDPFDIFREVFGGGGGNIFESIFGGGHDPSARSAATICATIWKSRSKKPRSAAKRKSPSPSPTNARPATAPARSTVQKCGRARPAAGADRC